LHFTCISLAFVFSVLQTTKSQLPTSQQPMVTTNSGPVVVTSPGKLRFQLAARHVILYCGSPRGTLDQVSLALFPLCFVIFSVMYWISYITESRRKALASVVWTNSKIKIACAYDDDNNNRGVILGVAGYAYAYLKFIKIVFSPDYNFSSPGKNNLFSFYWS